MTQINASTVTTTVALAFLLSFTGAATLYADSTMPSSIPSPLQAVAPPLGNGITALSLDHDAYANIGRLQAFDIADFPLSEDRQVDLHVRRIDVFSVDAQVVIGSGKGDQPLLARPDVVLLSGEVVGVPGSIVFLGLSPHGTHGYIQFPDEMFIISTRAGKTVIYSLTALPEGLLTLPDFQCDVIEVVDRFGADVQRNQTANGTSAQCRVVDIAIETDWEFTQVFGGDTEASSAYATILIGAASEIYSRDVFTTLKIVFLRVWAENNDPWNGGGLSEFVNFWNANMTHVQRDVAHFLSGRPGGGVAYLPGVCQEGFDYGYSSGMNGFFPYPLEHNNSQNWDIIVVCHELGHNFGSPHTHDYVPPIDECGLGQCENAENGTLMSYCHLCPGGLANFRLEFHPIVVETMLNYLANDAPCDTLADPADLDCDGSVGVKDLLILLGNWGPCADCADCIADLDGECSVGVKDLLILLGNWG